MALNKETTNEEKEEISISLSVMIHNANELDLNYSDLSPMNLTSMANMTASTPIYIFADIISNFYGISNSIISILDSVSDIFFIIFLWQLKTNNEHETNQNIIIFLIGLSIGNLISVAFAISMYTTNKVTSKYQNLLRFIFFLLSPCLPAFDWLLHKVQDYNPRMLVVYPECDGLMLWFQQELARNEIFLIESVFESSFQIIIQLIATLVLTHSDIEYGYLYASIIVSFIVILSKLILVSYNRKRSIIVFNLLCYLMDIFFSMSFALFIGALIFQKIFTAIGLYLVCELLILIPFCVYYGSYSLSLSRLTYIPALLIFCYPLTIFVLHGFFICPLLMYLLTDPFKIGKKELFHQKLYEYCCESQNEHEFNLKLVIINYICIKSQYKTLNAVDDPKYYSFATTLYDSPRPSWDMISTFDDFIKAKLNSKKKEYIIQWERHILKIVNLKAVQLLVRTILIACSLLLDVFYFQIFHTETRFMKYYNGIIVPFAAFGMILFCIWILSMLYGICLSKWNTFCYYMIASKHDSFVQLQTIDEFKKQCDEMLIDILKTDEHKNTKQQTNSFSKNKGLQFSVFWLRKLMKYFFTQKVGSLVKFPYKAKSVNLFTTIYGSSALFPICGIILTLSVLANTRYRTKECDEKHDVIFIYNLVTVSIVLLITFARMVKRIRVWYSNWTQTQSAIIFSVFSSQICVYFYTTFVYGDQCGNHYLLIAMVSTQIIACLFILLKTKTLSKKESKKESKNKIGYLEPFMDNGVVVMDETTHEINKRLRLEAEKEKKTIRILLLGPDNSGKETIMKQLNSRIMRQYIQDAVVGYMKMLCYQSQVLADQYDEKTLVNNGLEEIRKEFLSLQSPYDLTSDIASKIKTLWLDDGIRETLRCRHYYQIHDNVEYFFNRIDVIASSDYQPNFDDYLRIRTRSTGFACTKLIANIDKFGQHIFEFTDLDGQRSERSKWMRFISEDINAVLYIIAICDYDLKLFEDNKTNRLHEAINLFRTIMGTGKFSANKSVVIFFNQYSLFKEKIKKIPITVAFEDFPTDELNPNDEDDVVKFIAGKFLQVFQDQNINLGGPLHIVRTDAKDTDNIDKVFREITLDLVKQNLRNYGIF